MLSPRPSGPGIFSSRHTRLIPRSDLFLEVYYLNSIPTLLSQDQQRARYYRLIRCCCCFSHCHHEYEASQEEIGDRKPVWQPSFHLTPPSGSRKKGVHEECCKTKLGLGKCEEQGLQEHESSHIRHVPFGLILLAKREDGIEVRRCKL